VLDPIYAACGRLWPMSPLVDQQLGGLITALPAAMMSVIAAFIVLARMGRTDAPAKRSPPAPRPEPAGETRAHPPRPSGDPTA